MDPKLTPFFVFRSNRGDLQIDFDTLSDSAVFKDSSGKTLARVSIDLGQPVKFGLEPSVVISVPKRKGKSGDYVKLLPSDLKKSLHPETLRLLRYCSREYVFDIVDHQSDEVVYIFDHGKKFYVHIQT